METNIPIYRAKKTDSDKYVIGYLLPEYKGKFYLSIEWSRNFDGDTPDFVQIDISTLSIHFPDMTDSQGNKIFASLQENGKSGDVLNSGYGEVIIAIYEEGMIKFRYEESLPYNHITIDKIEDEKFLSYYEVWQIRDKLESEVIGIQE